MRSAEEVAAERHAERAQQLESDGHLDEAVAEWRLAHQDGLFPMTTRHVADLLEQGGRFEEALAEIDREGPRISWGEYCDLRGRVLERWKGVEVAVAWFLEEDAADPTKPFFQDRLGSFHYYGGRPREALAPLLEAERRALVRQGLRWDEQERLVPEDVGRTHGVNDLCDLWPTLATLASAYEALGEEDNAFQYATREVALHQEINRKKAYFGEAWQTAGSFPGRIVRARILLRRGDLDGAELELDYAAEVKGNYPEWDEQLAGARAQLADLRTK